MVPPDDHQSTDCRHLAVTFQPHFCHFCCPYAVTVETGFSEAPMRPDLQAQITYCGFTTAGELRHDLVQWATGISKPRQVSPASIRAGGIARPSP
jgi:hypothetical protein